MLLNFSRELKPDEIEVTMYLFFKENLRTCLLQ